MSRAATVHVAVDDGVTPPDAVAVVIEVLQIAAQVRVEVCSRYGLPGNMGVRTKTKPLLTPFSTFSARNCSTVSPGSQLACSVNRSLKTCSMSLRCSGHVTGRHLPP